MKHFEPIGRRFAGVSTVVAALAVAASVATTAASAQEHHGPGGHPGPAAHAFGAPHMQFDARYHHDHYYPARGYVSARLPEGAVSIGWRGSNYWYHGGVWFRPVGPRFVVIAPPIGIFVPVLPFAYATLTIGGAPYYYANGTYYAPAPGGYTVVDAPPGADDAQPLAAAPAYPPAPQPGYQPVPQAAAQPAPQPVAPPPPQPARRPVEPILYPRNGQSAAQTEADRQQCNSWATTQPSAVADAGVFQRAVAACMDGRGYTVR